MNRQQASDKDLETDLHQSDTQDTLVYGLKLAPRVLTHETAFLQEGDWLTKTVGHVLDGKVYHLAEQGKRDKDLLEMGMRELWWNPDGHNFLGKSVGGVEKAGNLELSGKVDYQNHRG